MRQVVAVLAGASAFSPSDLYARYNSNPNDDPGMMGSAAGATFAVPGLTPVAGGQAVGQIVFPEDSSGGGSNNLREYVDDPALGMPGGRDLNGDGVIDTNSHGADYTILPVRIVIQWESLTGPTRLEINSLITDK